MKLTFTNILLLCLSICNASKQPTVYRLTNTELNLPLFKNLYLKENLPSLLKNVIGPIKGTAYYWVLESFLIKLPHIEFLPRYSWKDQSQLLFFPKDKKQDDDYDKYYCSIPITQLPVNIMKQLEQLNQFSHLKTSSSINRESAPPHGALWLSSPGMNAAMHFDSSHNLLTQVSGYKKVTLVSPKYWKELHMFSSLHPLTRQSQLPIEDGPWAFQFHENVENNLGGNNYVKYHNEMIRKIEFDYFILSPGDVLEIPAFYFHSVSISSNDKDTSISINNYNNNDIEHKEILMKIYKIKFKKKYLKFILENVFIKLNIDLSKLSQDILKTRWYSIDRGDMFLSGNLSNATTFYYPTLNKHSNKELFIEVKYNIYERDNEVIDKDEEGVESICSHFDNEYGIQYEDIIDENYEEKGKDVDNNVKKSVIDLLSHFKTLYNLVPDAFEMLLADYLEIAIAKTIGANKVKSFLYCLGYVNGCKAS